MGGQELTVLCERTTRCPPRALSPHNYHDSFGPHILSQSPDG
jgi:hypothetical protein